jgi:hypothetical protein
MILYYNGIGWQAAFQQAHVMHARCSAKHNTVWLNSCTWHALRTSPVAYKACTCHVMCKLCHHVQTHVQTVLNASACTSHLLLNPSGVCSVTCHASAL